LYSTPVWSIFEDIDLGGLGQPEHRSQQIHVVQQVRPRVGPILNPVVVVDPRGQFGRNRPRFPVESRGEHERPVVSFGRVDHRVYRVVT